MADAERIENWYVGDEVRIEASKPVKRDHICKMSCKALGHCYPVVGEVGESVEDEVLVDG